MILVNANDTAALILSSFLKDKVNLLIREYDDPFRKIEIINKDEYNIINKYIKISDISKKLKGFMDIKNKKVIKKELWVLDINKFRRRLLDKKLSRKRNLIIAPNMEVDHYLVIRDFSSGEGFQIKSDKKVYTVHPFHKKYIKKIEVISRKKVKDYLYFYKSGKSIAFLAPYQNGSIAWSFSEKKEVVLAQLLKKEKIKGKAKEIVNVPISERNMNPFTKHPHIFLFGRIGGFYNKKSLNSLAIEIKYAPIVAEIIEDNKPAKYKAIKYAIKNLKIR